MRGEPPQRDLQATSQAEALLLGLLHYGTEDLANLLEPGARLGEGSSRLVISVSGPMEQERWRKPERDAESGKRLGAETVTGPLEVYGPPTDDGEGS